MLKGETLEDTVKRVAREETGLEVEIVKLVDVLEFSSFPEYFGQPVSVVYLAKRLSGTPAHNEQAEEIKAFSSLPENIIPEHAAILLKHFGF